jgi:hypothetical protein
MSGLGPSSFLSMVLHCKFYGFFLLRFTVQIWSQFYTRVRTQMGSIVNYECFSRIHKSSIFKGLHLLTFRTLGNC